MTQKPVVILKNIFKTYKIGSTSLNALDNINLSIFEGEMVSILGPSGSGKSTLLHIVGLLDTPSAGYREIGGVDTSKMSESEQSKLRGTKIGFVFQRFNLIPSLTALENVSLPLVITSKNVDRKEKASKILTSLGMGHRLDHYPSQLSGGQMQRVAIARALVNDPDVILADEPTGNLDSKTGKEVLDILKTLNSEGRTVIIITHDESITKHTKRVIKIVDGKVV